MSICLDADSGQAYDYGKIIQWDCNGQDSYQAWNVVYVGNGQYQLQNQGTNFCLDADAADAGSGGRMIQWTCSPSDPFQLFYITEVGNGYLSIKSFGASNASGTPICLDADYYTEGYGGYIQQYPCDTSDTYQLWYLDPTI